MLNLWVTLTAAYTQLPRAAVARVLRREPGPRPPWRFHVWSGAWLVAMFAILPFSLLVVAFLGRTYGADAGVTLVFTIVPPVVPGAMAVISGARSIGTPQVPLHAGEKWRVRETRREREVRLREDPSGGNTPLLHTGSSPWRWIGWGLLILVGVLRAVTWSS